MEKEEFAVTDTSGKAMFTVLQGWNTWQAEPGWAPKTLPTTFAFNGEKYRGAVALRPGNAAEVLEIYRAVTEDGTTRIETFRSGHWITL